MKNTMDQTPLGPSTVANRRLRVELWKVTYARGDTLVARDYKLWGNREWIKTLVTQLVLDWVRRSLLGINIAEASFIRR